MSDEKRFDPRFDPAFQRGFDASAERTRRANVTPSLTPEDVMYGRSARPDLAPPPPPPEDEAVDPGSASVAVPSQETRNRQNPFVLALWLLGALLVGGGIALLIGPTRMLYSNTFNSDQSNIAFFQMLYVVSPGLITVGLGTMSGLLFWHAAAWKARHRPG